MKKALLLSSVMVVGAIAANAQSGRVKPSNSALNSVQPIIRNFNNDGAVFLGTPGNTSFIPKSENVLGAKLVGTTCYDLQCNNAWGKNIINYGNGKFSFCWTADDACASGWANRGSGYNHWNGTSLVGTGTARIETVRTGFSRIATLGNGNEVIFAHLGSLDYQMSTSALGANTWTGVAAGATVGLGGGNPGLWNKVAAGGADGNTIHLLTGYNSGAAMGVATPFAYSRSKDAGQSWDKQSELLPGYDSTRTYGGGAEDYVIDANGVNVAVAQGGVDTDVFLWTSSDNGDNWTKTFVYQYPFAPSIDSTGAAGDTAATCDGGIDVVLDAANKAHVAYSTVRLVVGGYFPGDAELVYWNEITKTPTVIPIALADLDGNANGGNGTGAWEVGSASTAINNPASATPPNSRYGNKALLSMPSITVDGNNVFIVFSLVTDGDSTSDGRSFRDVWIVASPDKGVTWGKIQNLTCTQSEEEYYGILAKKTDNYIHLLYQWDTEPGTALQNGHAIGSNELRWAVVDKAKVLAGTANCSASGLGVNTINTAVFNVAQSYPNPTSGLTNFDVTVKQNANITLEIANALGQVVYTSTQAFNTGKHTMTVDASSFSSGLYVYTIRSGESVVSGKMNVNE